VILTTAGQGVYSADARGLSPERLKQHFLRGKGNNSGFIRIKPELARLIEFRLHNLMDAHRSLGDPFDIVFCRNVMIYFDEEARAKVVKQLVRHLMPGGYLFVGHSESLIGIRHSLKSVWPSVYCRTH
jgi:chemotaxis protein methyltransferase CheR